MGTDNLFIDLLSLDEFRLTLPRRLAEATAMLDALATAATPELPALGEFQDAHEVSGRYQTLHKEYVERLRQLADAITAAHEATGVIVDRYETDQALFRAKTKDIADTMRPVREVLNGGRPRA